MSKIIVMNVCPGETRVAVLEENRLVDISLERRGGEKQVGNIYRGRVENVLPGMQAAFVNIGMEKNAFLYVDDLNGMIPKADGVEIKKSISIKELLKEGQEIIVQMVKEPIGTKGARVVTHLTLAGRFLVFMPTMDYIGISRRIEDEKERERLKSIAQSIKPSDMGLIVRTAAEGMEIDELKADSEFLINMWRKIQKKAKKGPVPSLLYKDHDLLFRILRDIFTHEVDQLIIDDQNAFEKAVELLKGFAPDLKNRLQLYQSDLPIFDTYNIEQQLTEASRRRVWLDNGSYIVFDQTEALTVIDVNTGKFIGENSLNETVVLTNLSAAKEIARQIRLRNLA
ncbi:MAG TPA: Rne/Rng family ribonuclease, partial [Bacillota bacterium]|nr:Rne/Rng family ribonuclease [Bacillota bacterium]